MSPFRHPAAPAPSLSLCRGDAGPKANPALLAPKGGSQLARKRVTTERSLHVPSFIHLQVLPGCVPGAGHRLGTQWAPKWPQHGFWGQIAALPFGRCFTCDRSW